MAEGNLSSLVLYRTEDGQTRIECRFEGETLWLTQALMAELFQVTVPTINEHLKALLAEGEIEAAATIRKLRIVRMESARRVSREIEHYALPVVLAVGYRVRSPRGTQFRQWATARLTEFLSKGFTLDDPRLKHPPGPGVPDYFDELLERIRDIRASEARMYTRVRDLLALAIDYAPSATETHRLFQVVQNKLHHAVTGMTAPELIAARADASQPNMGLTSWKSGAVRRTDVTIAKNYLREGEIGELNRIVVMFLDSEPEKKPLPSPDSRRIPPGSVAPPRRISLLIRLVGAPRHAGATLRLARSGIPSQALRRRPGASQAAGPPRRVAEEARRVPEVQRARGRTTTHGESREKRKAGRIRRSKP